MILEIVLYLKKSLVCILPPKYMCSAASGFLSQQKCKMCRQKSCGRWQRWPYYPLSPIPAHVSTQSPAALILALTMWLTLANETLTNFTSRNLGNACIRDFSHFSILPSHGEHSCLRMKDKRNRAQSQQSFQTRPSDISPKPAIPHTWTISHKISKIIQLTHRSVN